MKVSRGQIIARGLANTCPNCGAPTLFPPGAHFTINRACSACGMKLSRSDGFYLGPLVINYTLTVAFVIVPLILLFAFDVIGGKTAIALCGTGAVLVPLALYRPAWSWWLMCYYYFLPRQLAANHDGTQDEDPD